ncbi:response regulator [Deinococcus lacus]|uniref:Response regulator n=1 Tax=Deinococcus lacus TaxID=392561 RepID=A0ABW1YEM1_9DEIO
MKRQILLVDDNPNDVELALTALEEGGQAEVLVAGGGQEALDMLEGGTRPDVVLLDLNMPQMDGLAVLEAIRKNSATSTVPVVILSTSDDERDVGNCYERGANAYVVKPMDFGQFQDAVKVITDFWTNLNQVQAKL